MADFSSSPSASSSVETTDMTLDASFSGPKNMETDDLPVNASQAANENIEAKDMTETSISEPVDVEAKATTIDASLSTTGNTGAPPSPVLKAVRTDISLFLKQMDLGHLKGLNESRTQLLTRVQALKKDLESWRGKLDMQVKSYRAELGDLRSSLNSEVEQLRVEFQDLRNTLKKQLELTNTKVAKQDEPVEVAVAPSSPSLSTGSPQE